MKPVVMWSVLKKPVRERVGIKIKPLKRNGDLSVRTMMMMSLGRKELTRMHTGTLINIAVEHYTVFFFSFVLLL